MSFTKLKAISDSLSKVLGIPLCFLFLLLIGIHTMQGWIASMRHGVKRKRSTKRLEHTGYLFRKNLRLKDVCYSRLKATKIIGKRKAFYRQRIPESSCARKETVDIDILVTSKNGDRKIMRSIRITSRPPLRKRKWNQSSQFRRTSTKKQYLEKRLKLVTFWRWVKGSREAAREGPTVLYIRFCSLSNNNSK